MSQVPWEETAASQARVLQIIVAALVVGCLSFLIVVLVIASPQGPAAGPRPLLLTWMATAVAAALLVGRWLVMQSVAFRARRAILGGTFSPFPGSPPPSADAERPDDAHCLLVVYQTRTIVGAAMLEGCAFFATIAYFIERSPVSLVLAGLLILGVASHLPSRNRVIDWVQRQLELLQQQRQFE